MSETQSGPSPTRYLVLVVFVPPLLLGCAGFPFTWHKLQGMKQIRGTKAGGTVETHVVRDKWQQSPSTFWITWTDRSVRVRGPHRLNLPEPVWNRYEIGDKIDIVFLPNDTTPYHRDGIYASDGNFMFDYALLAIEAGMLAIALIGAPLAFWIAHRMGR